MLDAFEGFFSRLRNELFYPRCWLNTTIDGFISALDSYIRWYNEASIKVTLGFRSPAEYRGAWESLLNPSQFSAAPPGGQNCVGTNT